MFLQINLFQSLWVRVIQTLDASTNPLLSSRYGKFQWKFGISVGHIGSFWEFV
jgi:hypothetical protein